jgi:hypothetical protein
MNREEGRAKPALGGKPTDFMVSFEVFLDGFQIGNSPVLGRD